MKKRSYIHGNDDVVAFSFKGEREEHRKGNETVTQDDKSTAHSRCKTRPLVYPAPARPTSPFHILFFTTSILYLRNYVQNDF